MSNRISKLEILKAINRANDANEVEDQETMIETFNKIMSIEERDSKYIKSYSLDKKTERSFSKHSG